MKRQPAERKKLFASSTPNILISETDEEPLNKIPSKTNHQFKNQASEISRQFSKEEIQAVNKVVEKVFSVIDHQRKANQSHIETLFHPSQSGCH